MLSDAAAVLKGVRVVVVDDEDDPRALFSEVLEMAGARVAVASSAREALALIEREVPDVLVSDIMMPGEDGYWLIKAVRLLQSEGSRRIRALAITGDPVLHARDRVLRAGYDAHIGKPMGVDALCALVARLAGRS
jgi:CheY-like chemotaxis protein